MSNLWKRKSLDTLIADTSDDGHALKKTLGAFNLVALGIGAIIGAGLFVRTAAAAADHAGPSVTLGFVVAAVGCAFAGLCYAEFASMIPIAGSAYTYSYATMGELVAWIIGWDLVLEYAIGAATVGIAWSEYLNKLLEFLPGHHQIPYAWCHSPFQAVHDAAGNVVAHGIMNLPAAVHRAHADAPAHPRHAGVGVRQRDHRHHQGHHRHPHHHLRLELHRPGEPHAVHPAAADRDRQPGRRRTTTAAFSASSAPPASSSSPSSASTRCRPPRRRR